MQSDMKTQNLCDIRAKIKMITSSNDSKHAVPNDYKNAAQILKIDHNININDLTRIDNNKSYLSTNPNTK